MLGKVSVQLRAEQRKSLPGRAGMKDRVERGGQGRPGGSACLPPQTASAPPTLALPSRDCVGGQWVRRCCARSRTLGKLRQQPGLEQGICFPAGCTERGVSPTLPPSTLSRVLPQRGIYEAGITLLVSYQGLYHLLPPPDSAARGQGLAWLAHHCSHSLAYTWCSVNGDSLLMGPKFGDTLYSSQLFQGL